MPSPDRPITPVDDTELRAATTSEPYDPVQPRINDRCPACDRRTLFIGAGGLLTCSFLTCPQPCAGAAIMAQRQALAQSEARAERLEKALREIVQESAFLSPAVQTEIERTAIRALAADPPKPEKEAG